MDWTEVRCQADAESSVAVEEAGSEMFIKVKRRYLLYCTYEEPSGTKSFLIVMNIGTLVVPSLEGKKTYRKICSKI